MATAKYALHSGRRLRNAPAKDGPFGTAAVIRPTLCGMGTPTRQDEAAIQTSVITGPEAPPLARARRFGPDIEALGMTAVDIRPASGEDVPELTDVAVGAWRRAHAGVLAAAALHDGLATLTAEIHDGWEQMFVAEKGSRLVGFFSFTPGTSRIRHIYVHRDKHRQGIGSLMMAAAFDILRDRGFHEATIEVIEGTDGDGFHRALGWREMGREPRADGTVAISMWKKL